MKLREYQQEAVRSIYTELSHGRATLLVLATGLGKTVVFAHVVKACVERGKRVMVLAHREELIFQAADKIKRVCGITPEVEMAEYRSAEYALQKCPVVVSTIQTQCRGRMERFKPHDFGLLVVDEAHHAVAETYRRVIDHFRQNATLKVLGVTATPDRADEEALGQVFDTVAFEFGIREGVEGGWLVPIKQRLVHIEGLDFSQIRTTAGDLNGADLAATMEYEKNLYPVADATVEQAGGRKTLVFAASVAHAHRLAEIIERQRPGMARVVTGTTPKDERAAMFRDFKAGKFQFLCNVGVATEGFDEPGVALVVMARPTKSRCLYSQTLGRGTRPLDGVVDGPETPEERRAAIAASDKPHMTVLDFVGNCGRHKLVHAADVLGGNVSDRIVEQADKEIEDSDEEEDVLAKMRKLEEDEAKRQDEEAKRKRKGVIVKAQFSITEIDPFDVLGITPKREPGWHKGRQPSPAMIAAMERRGITGAERLSWWQVKQVLSTASPKQAKVLQRAGWWEPGLSFEQARERMDVLAKNQWQKPVEVAS